MKCQQNNKDYFDQSLDEIKLLKFVNSCDPHDEHGIVRLYDYFYYKVGCRALRASVDWAGSKPDTALCACTAASVVTRRAVRGWRCACAWGTFSLVSASLYLSNSGACAVSSPSELDPLPPSPPNS